MNKSDDSAATPPRRDIKALVNAGLKRRHAAERRFRWYGLTAISLGLAFVVLMFANIIGKGYPAFWQTYIEAADHLRRGGDRPAGTRDPETLANADYAALIRASLRGLFPQVEGRRDLRALYGLIGSNAPHRLRGEILADPALIGTTQTIQVLASAEVDTLVRATSIVPSTNRCADLRSGNRLDRPAHRRRPADKALQYHPVQQRRFARTGTGRHPWRADGFLLHPADHLPAVFSHRRGVGGVSGGIRPKNRWTDLIEVNINNLAAVPSIVFGLLGLAVFINFFGLPRSAPLVGGLVLSLMTLPVIIIASRAA